MADRISLRKARSGHVPTPEPARDRVAEAEHRISASLSGIDAYASESGPRSFQQSAMDGYLAGWGDGPIDVDAQRAPPPPPAPPTRHVRDDQRPATNTVTVSPPPLDPSIIQRISNQVARAFRREQPQTTLEPEDASAPPLHAGGTVTGWMTGPPAPNLSNIPRAVPVGPHAIRVGTSLTAQADSARTGNEGMVIQAWDDIRTREHAYGVSLTGLVLETRVAYEDMAMYAGNEDEKALYWARGIAIQLTASLEQQLTERLYELLRNNRRIG